MRALIFKVLGALSLFIFSQFNLSRAERGLALDTDRMSFQVRIDQLLDPQTMEINTSTYIIKPDNVGEGVLAAMIKKVEQGGKARLLVDAWGFDMNPALINYAQSKGVEIKVFRPVSHLARPTNWKPKAAFETLNNRMHDKMMIFDNERMVLGGRNLDTQYFLTARERRVEDKQTIFLDMDVYIEGQSVGAAKEYFLSLFNSDKTETVNFPKSSPEDLLQVEQRVNELYKKMQDVVGKKPWKSLVSDVAEVRFSSDSPQGKRRGQGSIDDIIGLIDSAQHTLIIHNPYVLFTPQVWAALQRARERKVEINLFTGASWKTDMLLGAPAFDSDVTRMLAMGINIFQYNEHRVFHSKIMCADHSLSYLGSFNLDPRSENFNTETGVVVRDSKIADQIMRRTRSLESRSVRRLTNANPYTFSPETAVEMCRRFFESIGSHLLRPLL
jgi:putative cardiolipin synthase